VAHFLYLLCSRYPITVLKISLFASYWSARKFRAWLLFLFGAVISFIRLLGSVTKTCWVLIWSQEAEDTKLKIERILSALLLALTGLFFYSISNQRNTYWAHAYFIQVRNSGAGYNFTY
jgi:hypothetical protein